MPKDRAPITGIKVEKSNLPEKVEKWLWLWLNLKMEKDKIIQSPEVSYRDTKWGKLGKGLKRNKLKGDSRITEDHEMKIRNDRW